MNYVFVGPHKYAFYKTLGKFDQIEDLHKTFVKITNCRFFAKSAIFYQKMQKKS